MEEFAFKMSLEGPRLDGREAREFWVPVGSIVALAWSLQERVGPGRVRLGPRMPWRLRPAPSRASLCSPFFLAAVSPPLLHSGT